MMIPFKTAAYRLLAIHPLSKRAYPPIALFLWLIYLTAKALRRITMRAFLVGAIEPKKCILKLVQLRILGLRTCADFRDSTKESRFN